MAEQPQPANPAEEITRFWQSWMGAGMEAMQRTTTLFAPGAAAPEWMAAWREQMETAMRAALEAARIPSAQELQRIAQGLETLRSTVGSMQAGMAALESLLQGQQEMWRAVEGSARQAAMAQEKMQGAMAAWTRQWEDRLAGVTRGMEEWRERWEEMLQQGLAMSQASQKGLEDLTKTMWDLSRKMMGGQG